MAPQRTSDAPAKMLPTNTAALTSEPVEKPGACMPSAALCFALKKPNNSKRQSASNRTRYQKGRGITDVAVAEVDVEVIMLIAAAQS